MSSYRDAISSLNHHQAIKELLATLQESAGINLEQTRGSITQARDYFDDFQTLTDQVVGDLTQSQPINQYEVIVLLTANAGFYGELLDRLSELFIQTMTQHPQADIVVIGSAGEQLVNSLPADLHAQILYANDNRVDPQLVDQLVTRLQSYGTVHLCFAQYQNLAHQIPTYQQLRPLSANLNLNSLDAPKLAYLYEPSKDQIQLVLANNSLRGTIEQSLWEERLAQFAARFSHLEVSLSKIDKEIGKLNQNCFKLRRRQRSHISHQQIVFHRRFSS